MFCEKCGKKVKDNSLICDKCGNSFENRDNKKGPNPVRLVLSIVIGAFLLIFILGLVAAIIIPDFVVARKLPKTESCEADLRGLQAALEMYYTHYKCYPQDLKTLIKENYINENSDKDPWGCEIRYQPIYNSNDKSKSSASNYLIGSSGPDRYFVSDDDINPPINTKSHSFKK